MALRSNMGNGYQLRLLLNTGMAFSHIMGMYITMASDGITEYLHQTVPLYSCASISVSLHSAQTATLLSLSNLHHVLARCSGD